MPSSVMIGEPAPIFSLPDHTGNINSLEDYQGNWLILYFYPKDNSSGCTIEALAFTGIYEELKKSGIPVIGISPDSPSTHTRFIDKNDLKIILLSDEDHQVCEEYAVWKVKKMYGKEFMGVERATFIIDPSGIIRQVWRKVRVKGHVEDVLSRLTELIHNSSA